MDLKKAYEITDAKISFVSLVDKAANGKTFLITKAEEGNATFETYGRIVKADSDKHYVVGVVYEPMTADAHDNFMTEEEIQKAAYAYMRNNGKIDIQHNFEPFDGAAVVESWIAKADFLIGNETIKKGTWLLGAEITDPKIWDSIEKGEITGFSMGGVGKYSKEDVQLNNDTITKTTDVGNEAEQNERKSVFKRLAELFGFDVVEKGQFKDSFEATQKARDFWAAFDTLRKMLEWWSYGETNQYEDDPEKINEALTEFSEVITDVLSGGEAVTKAIITERPVNKAGKKISGANRDKLQEAYNSIGELLASFADPEPEPKENDGSEGDKNNVDNPEPDDEGEEDSEKEDEEVTKAEIEQMVKDAVTEAITKATGEQQTETKPESQPDTEVVSKEEVQEMVSDMVTKAVSDAVEPLFKARGIPTALSNGGSGEKPVEKHYLHGIL